MEAIVQASQTAQTPRRLRCQQDERRAHPRLSCKGVAEILVLPWVKRVPGTLLDLSVKGCCIDAGASLTEFKDTSVEVLLTVNGSTLRLAGVVRNVRREHRAGIEFIDITERKAAQIRELVEELLARYVRTRSARS